ncbi:hypothetical protein B0H13DRAFT_2416065 [Mycena leptocephala]|nr:hypothetical protein B0H13DRAFT_2416065 [Mycena leptocephala]
MITDVNLTHATSRTMMSRPLKRGRACMNCRFLKIKCDGQKPICGPCRKHPKDDECEYSDGPARSRTKALEDTVQRLEARLHELEHPEDSTPSVTLYDPYPQYTSPPQLTISPSYPTSRSLPNTPYHQLPRGYTPLSPFSPPSTTATTPPFGTHGHGSSPLGIFDSRVMTTPESTSSSLESDQNICEAFLQTFRPHASEFGFFLDWNRFIQSALHSILSDGTMRTSALLNAIYMWGAHLSSDGQRELYFKHKALSFAASELTPKSFLHTIQAEVLLSHFFFRTGHFLEARAHTAPQLHWLSEAACTKFENDQGIHLRAPADAIEEGERINGFWAVFVLQKNLSVALEPAVGVCGVFETMACRSTRPGRSRWTTIDRGAELSGAASITAMNVKASMLLHRAVYLHGSGDRVHVPEREAQSWWTAFSVVDQLINALRAELPDIAQLQGRSTARTILLTQSLLNAATIKLHRAGYLNPMMGTLWMTACNVFIDELRRIRAESAHSTWPLQAASEQEREKEMLASLQDGLDALSAFAHESLLMRHQLTKAQKALGAIQ